MLDRCLYRLVVDDDASVTSGVNSVTVSDSVNGVSSSMSSSRYHHDNSAVTEQRVAQILSEARAAMNAADAPQTKVNISFVFYQL